jgi:hypothetical protein
MEQGSCAQIYSSKVTETFRAFYGTRSFITVLTRDRHQAVSSARRPQFMPHLYACLRIPSCKHVEWWLLSQWDLHYWVHNNVLVHDSQLGWPNTGHEGHTNCYYKNISVHKRFSLTSRPNTFLFPLSHSFSFSIVYIFLHIDSTSSVPCEVWCAASPCLSSSK